MERLQNSLLAKEGAKRMRSEETVGHLEKNGVERKSLGSNGQRESTLKMDCRMDSLKRLLRVLIGFKGAM